MENTEIDMARKSRVGRPPKSEDEKAYLVPVRFRLDQLDAIDAAADDDAAITGRSAMIRALVAEALAARARRK